MCPQFPVLFPAGKSVCRKKPFSLLLWHVLTPLSSGFHEIITKIHTETERPFSKAVHSRQLRSNCRKCRKKENRFVENVAFKRENSVRCDKNYGKPDSILQKPAVHAIIKLYRQMKDGIPCISAVCMTGKSVFRFLPKRRDCRRRQAYRSAAASIWVLRESCTSSTALPQIRF